MAELSRRRTPLIDPVYPQAAPNQPIELGDLAVQFEHRATTHHGIARFAMRFMPDDGLEFVVPIDSQRLLFGFELINSDNPLKNITLTERGVSFEAFCVGFGGDNGGAVFTPTKTPLVVTRPSSTIVTAKFHLFNAPKFYGPENYVLLLGEPPNEGGVVCGCVTLKAAGWKITIAATQQTDEVTDALKSHGGHVITHMGQIEHEDGSEFSSDMLIGLLSALHQFLSFAFGRWAGIGLVIGFDVLGNKCFEEWGPRVTADGHWRGSSSWFDIHHAELLSQAFPGFLALWANDLWKTPLLHALYWYLGACDRRVGIGPDSALIFAQAALEVLAWTHCILDKKILSSAAFRRRGLSAADKFRVLASSLGIPKAIPQQLSALHAKTQPKWTDALDAITGIRNSLVHPDATGTLPENSYYEAWNLSLWYIEMALLRLFEHSGAYANRLLTRRSVGQIEPVPWANQGEKEAPMAP